MTAARIATTLARALLLLYPSSFRKDMGRALVDDVRRRAAEKHPVWIASLVASLVVNAVGAWAEAMSARVGGPQFGPAYVQSRNSLFAWTDLKLALRMLVKYPGLTLTGGLGIAVAIAISVGFFSFLHTYFYPTIPLPEGHRLVGLENWDRRTYREDRRSLYDFALWRSEMKSVEDMSAFQTVDRNLIDGSGGVERVLLAEITPSGFRLARVPPLMGRTLVDTDAAPGAAPVLVIGFDEWRSRFASAPDIVGRDVRLGRTFHKIVGVMPEGFKFPKNHRFWIPFKEGGVRPGEGPSWIFISARLAPGFTMDDAHAELMAIGDRTAAQFPDTHKHLRTEVVPYHYPFGGMNRYSAAAFWPMVMLFSLLLVIICVNVAVLIYARTATRLGEIAVRSALGASRRRIVLQLFAESLVFSSVAAAVGVGIVSLAVSQANRLDDDAAFWTQYRVSESALGYAVALTVLAAVITGVIPALQATGRRAQNSLRQFQSGVSLRLGRTWTTMIVAQVAVAVAAAPIVIALSWHEVRDDLTVARFPVEQVLFAQLGLEPELGKDLSVQFARMRTELSRRLDATAGVVSHAFTSDGPGGGSEARVEIEHIDEPGREARRSTVDLNFFRTFDVDVIAGRSFVAGDQTSGASAAAVVVVNRAFARRFLGDGTTLGRRIRFVDDQRWYEIVGVVENIEANQFSEARTAPRVYHPMPELGGRGTSLAIRVAGADRGILSKQLQEIVVALDPAVKFEVVPLEREYEWQRMFLMVGAAGIGVALLSVLLLSAAGIYALMSFTVAQRRREIAIRTALGAQPRQLLGGILSRALRQIMLGVAIGVGIALLINFEEKGEVLRGYGKVLLSGSVLVMSVVGLLATLGPARRGLRIDPLEALKGE